MYILVLTFLLNGNVEKIEKDLILEKEECFSFKEKLELVARIARHKNPNKDVLIECVKKD